MPRPASVCVERAHLDLCVQIASNGVTKGTPKCKDSLGFGVADSHAKGFQDLKEDYNAVEELLESVKGFNPACSMVVVREDREHSVDLSGANGASRRLLMACEKISQSKGDAEQPCRTPRVAAKDRLSPAWCTVY